MGNDSCFYYTIQRHFYWLQGYVYNSIYSLIYFDERFCAYHLTSSPPPISSLQSVFCSAAFSSRASSSHIRLLLCPPPPSPCLIPVTAAPPAPCRASIQLHHRRCICSLLLPSPPPCRATLATGVFILSATPFSPTQRRRFSCCLHHRRYDLTLSALYAVKETRKRIEKRSLRVNEEKKEKINQ